MTQRLENWTASLYVSPGLLSHKRIAAIMTARGMPMSTARVWQLEQRALRKIRREFERSPEDWTP